MEEVTLTVLGLLIVGFGLISGRIENTSLTPPMVFVGMGWLVGPSGLKLIHVDPESPLVHLLAELTLMLILFSDASRIDLMRLRRQHAIPVRLLGIGLPLTMVAGAAVAVPMFPELGLWSAVVLAVILAPTDAALGQAVVSSEKVPVRIRQALNVESGLNDGMALPVLLFFVCLASAVHEGEQATGAYWLRFAALQIVLGPACGILVGWLGGKLVTWGSASGWMSHAFRSLSALGLSLLSYGLAESIGGNGFLAAFCAGLVLGNTARQVSESLYEFAETEGQLLTLLTFSVVGAVMIPEAIRASSPMMWLYAVLSLTVIRGIPVALSLIGLRLRGDTTVFLAWFGPRGIASVLYGLVVLEMADVRGHEEIFTITLLTVLLSVLAHGVTAAPSARAYAARLRPDCPEQQPVHEMPVRLPFRKA